MDDVRLKSQDLARILKMKTSKCLIVTTAAVLILGTSMAVAQQQEPSRGAPAEKATPKSPVNEHTGEPSTHAPAGARSQK
jgi:hypothetical protein